MAGYAGWVILSGISGWSLLLGDGGLGFFNQLFTDSFFELLVDTFRRFFPAVALFGGEDGHGDTLGFEFTQDLFFTVADQLSFVEFDLFEGFEDQCLVFGI